MTTRTDEIADDIYRISTFVPEIAPPTGFTFNQFLIVADEPLLFHCGPKAMFPEVSTAVAAIVPLEKLRWISFGHVEGDECGSMNQWLAAAPEAQIVYNELGCELSVSDLADRPPKALSEAEVLELGGKQVQLIPTPHVPHGWEAQVLYEQTTRTLFCGDLFSHVGNTPPVVEEDITGPAMAAEDMFNATGIGPATAPTLRRLADLSPRVLAVMHGASFRGDGREALMCLADRYEERVRRR